MARRSSEDQEDADAPTSRRLGLPLQDREEVLMSASPSAAANFYKYIYTLGLYGLWRRRDTAVVTNRRLLLGRGIVSRDERSISLSQIESARFVRKGLNAYAQITIVDRGGRKTERIGPMPAREARVFVSEILAHQ